ncbi:MAG: hypothetical protein R2705_19010 [Ilumatobacteraceae bacterium]
MSCHDFESAARERSFPLDAEPPDETFDETDTLARWLERRLDETTDWLLDEARLYGLTVNDPAALLAERPGAARFCLLDRGYPYDVLDGPASLLAANFDAVGLVNLGWSAPLEDRGSIIERPSRHPARRRVRIVTVARIDPSPRHSIVATAIRDRATGEVTSVRGGEGRIVEGICRLAAESLAMRLAA